MNRYRKLRGSTLLMALLVIALLLMGSGVLDAAGKGTPQSVEIEDGEAPQTRSRGGTVTKQEEAQESEESESSEDEESSGKQVQFDLALQPDASSNDIISKVRDYTDICLSDENYEKQALPAVLDLLKCIQNGKNQFARDTGKGKDWWKQGSIDVWYSPFTKLNDDIPFTFHKFAQRLFDIGMNEDMTWKDVLQLSKNDPKRRLYLATALLLDALRGRLVNAANKKQFKEHKWISETSWSTKLNVLYNNYMEGFPGYKNGNSMPKKYRDEVMAY